MPPDGSSPLTHRRRRGWPLIGLLGAGVVLIVFAFWVITDPLGGEDSTDGSHYTEAVVGFPSRANPLFVHLSDADRDIASLVFSGLIRLDKNGSPQPDLAERWEISEDGKTVTFHLRSGVTWHSGAEFSSSDVLFTYALLASPDVRGDPEQSALWSSVSCAAPDALTVTCTLPEPYSPFLTYASVGILPKSALEAVGPAAIADDPFNRSPIGTGPYRLTHLDDSSATLRANGNYYFGAPSIDEVSLRFYPDIAAAAADLVRGKVDGLPWTSRSIQMTSGSSRSKPQRIRTNRSAYTAFSSTIRPLLSTIRL
jgi:peptide/nickel transport system substrate-binding protein